MVRLTTIAARVLRARAPNIDEARAVANHCADARELWERLAARGVIPSEWIDDPRRQFAATAPVE